MAKPFGFFNPPQPRTDWLSDGEGMRLVDDFHFVDEVGSIWKCAAGSVVNGASIPRFFWRVIGPPLRGRYRFATIPHDVHCVLRLYPSPEVHRMFYRAMRASGVGRCKAWVMWFAVRFFGPRW